MNYRKVERPIAAPRRCDCSLTSFVSINEQWLVIVDAIDESLIAKKWTLQDNGGLYAICWRGGKKQWLHRVILPAPELVDYENGHGLDCRRHNLRPATRRQNQFNSKARIGTSAYKGVYWKRTHNKWHASIRFEGKRKSLGHFDSEIDAAKAYNAAAINLHGSFARLNII